MGTPVQLADAVLRVGVWGIYYSLHSQSIGLLQRTAVWCVWRAYLLTYLLTTEYVCLFYVTDVWPGNTERENTGGTSPRTEVERTSQEPARRWQGRYIDTGVCCYL